jgi:DNA-binding IscR family transcriptional regulator
MKLTSFTDDSLRVLIFLAADPARRASLAKDRRVLARIFLIA